MTRATTVEVPRSSVARLRPRKRPAQARAQKRVQRILDATRDILVAEGAERLTTNRVAELAGVNIASVYQYFPNKNAVMEAVLERELERAAAVLGAQGRAGADLPVDRFVRAWLEKAVALFRADEALLRIVFQTIPPGSSSPVSRAADAALLGLVRDMLSARFPHLGSSDLDRIAFVAFNSVALVLHKHMIDPAPGLTDAAVIDELVALVTRYLEPIR